MPAVFDVVAGGQLDPILDRALHIRDETGQIAAANVRLDGDAAMDVLASDLRGTFLDGNIRELRERNHAALRIGNLQVADLFDVVARPHHEADLDSEPPLPLQDLTHLSTAHRLHDIQHL